jgi:Proliferating cell nuclear antigen, N-terminal domain
MPLGVNLASSAKVLKCTQDDDVSTIKAGADADLMDSVYEPKSACSLFDVLLVSSCSLNIDGVRIAVRYEVNGHRF